MRKTLNHCCNDGYSTLNGSMQDIDNNKLEVCGLETRDWKGGKTIIYNTC